MGLLLSLSPNAPPHFAAGVDGKTYLVNGIDPPRVIDGAGAIRLWGMVAPAAPAVASGGAGVLTGSYYYMVTWKNSNTAEYGARSPQSTKFVAAANQINVTKPSTAGIDPQVTDWVLWRNTAGQKSTFYKQGEYTIGTASTTDNVSDETIRGQEVFLAPDNVNANRNPPASFYAYIADYKGLKILYGARVEETGTVTLTNGANTVTGAGTQFTQAHKGGKLYDVAGNAVYIIDTVTNSTTATIKGTYAGATDGGKAYKITAANPSRVAWTRYDSEGLDDLASADVFPNDGDDPSGLIVAGGVLLLCKKQHLYSFEFGINPSPILGSGVIASVLSGRGLVRQEAAVSVSGRTFLLDSLGIYVFDGSASGLPNDQAIRRRFHWDDGIDAADRINFAMMKKYAHAIYEPKGNAVWFFIPTGSETYPKTAYVWEIERERWLVHQFPFAVTASCMTLDADGQQRATIGDENGYVWFLGGVHGVEGTTQGTINGTATSAVANKLTDAGAAFYTTGQGLAGMPIRILAGTGAGQERIVSSNTGTELTISPNWTVTPDATSVYAIGAMETVWRYPWMTPSQGERQTAATLTVYFTPTAADRIIYVRFYRDYEAQPVKKWAYKTTTKDGLKLPTTVNTDGWLEIHTNEPSGRVDVVMDLNAKAAISVEFRELAANRPVTFRGFDFDAIAGVRTWRAE